MNFEIEMLSWLISYDNLYRKAREKKLNEMNKTTKKAVLL